MGDSTDKTQRTGFLRRLARARDGGVALVFGLALPPLMMMTVAGVDLHRVENDQGAELDRLTDSFHLNLLALGLLAFASLIALILVFTVLLRRHLLRGITFGAVRK